MRSKSLNTQETRVGLRSRGPAKWTETAFVHLKLLAGPLEGWEVEAGFTLADGVVEHGPVTYTPPPGVALGSLSTTELKRLSLHGALGHLEDELRRLDALAGVDAQGWIDALTVGRKPGVRGQDPNVYLLWAQRRVEAERQHPEAPIKWLAKQFEHLGYTRLAIDKYVYMAREKGFLTPSNEPVDLTPRAKRLLSRGAQRGKR